MSTQPTTAPADTSGDGKPRGKNEYHDRGPGYIAGNLTRDPELRFTPDGRAVCTLRVADSPRVRDGRTGEWKEGPTVYRDVQCWNRLAEHCCEQLKKGDRIVATGTVKSRTWHDDQGAKQERIYLEARDLGPSMVFRPATIGPMPPKDVSR